MTSPAGATIDVFTAQQLDDAIKYVDSGQMRNLQGQLTNDITIHIEKTLDAPLKDYAAFDNSNAHVVISGVDDEFSRAEGFPIANNINGDDQFAGFRVLSGNVAISNLNFVGMTAKGGDGGEGMIGGGGGAG